MSDNKNTLIQDDIFDIKKIIFKFLYFWKYYLLSLFLCILLGAIYIRYSNPMYKIHSKLLIQEPEGSKGATSGMLPSSQVMDFSGLFDVQNNIYNELYILQTRDLLNRVVDKMDLTKVYRTEGSIRDVDQYKRSPFKAYFEPASDSLPDINMHIEFKKANTVTDFLLTLGENSYKGKIGDTLALPTGKLILNSTGQAFLEKPYVLTIRSKEAMLAEIKNNYSVLYDDKETSILILNYNSNVPRKGEDFLKALIDAYMNRNLIEKNEMNDSTIAFINERIGIVSGELGIIEKDIEGFKQANKLVNLDEQAKAIITSGSEYYQKLNESDVQLGIINTMLTFVNTDKNNNRPVPALITNDPSFVLLIQQYNSLLIQKSKLLVSVKESNPLIQNINAQITTLRNDIERNLSNQKKNIEIGRNQIVVQNEKINQMVYAAPAQERQYIDFTREKDVKQALYLYLLQKKEETSITKASNVSNATVIETPKSDYLPYFPDKMVIIAAALMLGLAVPTLIILLKDLFNNRINTKEEITSGTKVSIIAQIGHSENAGLLSVNKDSRNAVAEQLRVLRTNLDFIAGTNNCPVILSTSSSSGEGKSFISGNIGQLFALAGKKVLLMEMDLRKPTLSKIFGLSNELGFSNYAITNDKSILEFVSKAPSFNNLYILSSGPVPPNPAELILSKFNESLLETLKQNFDVIIVDSPPYGIVTDTQLLTKFSDINLFVIRLGFSFKMCVNQLNEMHTKHPGNLYAIVNDVKKTGRYQYGNYYGYGYGYGNGYYSDEKKQSKFFRKRVKS